MSVVFTVDETDICNLQWRSSSVVVPGGGQYQLDWTNNRAGQPIAFTLVQNDGDPASASISLSGVEYIKAMQCGASAIYTTANIPYLAANESLTVFGAATAGGTITFTILMKYD
jgi:hypothetical protein